MVTGDQSSRARFWVLLRLVFEVVYEYCFRLASLEFLRKEDKEMALDAEELAFMLR